MALDTYRHVFDELDGGEQEAIKVPRERAKRDRSTLVAATQAVIDEAEMRRGRSSVAFLRSIRAGSAGLGREDVVPAGRADPV